MFKKTLLITLILVCLLPWGKVMAQSSHLYEEGFESMSTYSSPTGWYKTQNTTSVQANNSNGGSNSLRFGGNYSTATIVAMPSFGEYQINTLQLAFYHKSSANNVGTFQVGYVTNTSDASTFVAVATYNASNSTISYAAQPEIVSMSTAPNNAYIAFCYSPSSTYKYWYIDDLTVDVEVQSCSVPASLTTEATSSTTANVTWTAGGTESEWLLYYSTSSAAPADDLYSGIGVITGIDATSYTLENLTANTTYHVWVRAKCDTDDYSAWTDAKSFKTMYVQSLPFSYGFEDGGAALDHWTMREKNDNTGTYNSEANNGSSYCFRFNSPYSGSTQYLISPELNGTSYGVRVTLYRKQPYAGAWIQVGYSTTTTAEFTWSDATPNQAASSYVLYEISCPANTKFVAIKYTATTSTPVYIDDISLTVPDNTFTTVGNWSISANWSYGTLPASTDDIIINAACTIPANCIAQANSITFGTNGSLTIADGGQLICNNAVAATVKKTINGHTPTDKSGWNFIASPIKVTDYPYGISPADAGLITDTYGNNIPDGQTASYDLYKYEEHPDDGYEWRNYRNNSFNLEMGSGYLYANVNTITLNFTGTLRSCAQPAYEGLDITSSAGLPGWNLVGNPFPCNATIDRPYYILTNGILTAKASTIEITPCAGVMVQAAEIDIVNNTINYDSYTETVKFTKAGTGSTPQPSQLQMTVVHQVMSRGEAQSQLQDNAIVSFNEGNYLEKFVFNAEASKLYIPQGGMNFAIVSAEAQGELPVNFKAAEDGTYTITVNPEGVEMNYLHLIDNMTGMDIDLLQTPSYTFDATTRDYESRFRLVFGANNENGASGSTTFAYFNGSEWQVSNEGEATLQVIDMMGRIVSTETVNGNCNLNLNQNAGVYMLRLINSNGVKTQKVVVR